MLDIQVQIPFKPKQEADNPIKLYIFLNLIKLGYKLKGGMGLSLDQVQTGIFF